MELGLGVLGWSPDQFWQATPTEVKLAMNGWMQVRGQQVTKTMTRSRLDELMARYPDGQKE